MAANKKIINKAKDTQEKPVTKSATKPSNLTPDELAIFHRVKSAGQKREWESITEGDMHDFSLGDDPFRLPEFAQKLKDEKTYAFRWIERSRERIDEINSLQVPFKWWLVTMETLPESFENLDPNLGCVCIYDQMLVFKPFWMFLKHRQIVEGVAESKDKAGSLEAKHLQPIDETGSEFLADRRARISGRDQVIMHEGNINEQTGGLEFKQGDDGDLGDIIEQEE